MRNFIGLAILGSAMLAAVPASASNTTFNFLNCGDAGNPSCSSSLSSYAVSNNGVTATAVAFYATGTSTGPGSGSDLTAASVGSYSGAGLGICENQTGDNCASPNHQIDNGANTTLSGGNGTGADDFEFMLIQFNAAVNLSDIVLGNYGDTNANSNPFTSTYFVSSSSLGLTAMETALEGTTLSSLTGEGFGSTGAQEGCTTGATTSTATNNSSCAENATGVTENLTGSGVTYLLIGASDLSGAAGTDFFKIQDIDANKITATPEPATFGLLGLALTGLGVYGRKRKSSIS